MKDELVKFETAVLAKEVGFNLCVVNLYNKLTKKSKEYLTTGCDYDTNRDIEWDWNLLGGSSGNLAKVFPYPNTFKGEVYSAPTQSLLQRWLRETHNIYVLVNYYGKDQFWVEVLNSKGNTFVGDTEDNDFSTYEEALEYGLFEALTWLKEN